MLFLDNILSKIIIYFVEEAEQNGVLEVRRVFYDLCIRLHERAKDNV